MNPSPSGEGKWLVQVYAKENSPPAPSFCYFASALRYKLTMLEKSSAASCWQCSW